MGGYYVIVRRRVIGNNVDLGGRGPGAVAFRAQGGRYILQDPRLPKSHGFP